MKKLLSFLLIGFFTALCFAIPGSTSFIADTSGEYVFYRDYSFTRETYIGLLYYSESEYQIKYYAPEDKKQFLPEKEIAILISIDSDSNFWNMTGENIMSNILPNDEDTLLVNYLHDIMYDFSSRRNKISSATSDNYEAYQDYAQFGGNVKITYDARIPMFNIKSIKDSKNNLMLECITIGQLKSSEDKSFDNFKGLHNTTSASEKKQIKKAKQFKANYNDQSIILDDNWKQAMENIWTMGDDSLISLAEIPKLTEDNNFNELYIQRKLLESSDSSFIDFSGSEIYRDSKKGQFQIKTKVYELSSGKIVQNIKILTKKQPGKGFISEAASDYYFCSISTYQSAYMENPSYFDKLTKSYSAN